ncbi:DUF3040 domain-containing protein [Pseudonocardia halophobica]|uniref:DUF3040 domain-containing protein n=1 Tax=Pseudonocardia halophobica TaxID=29401 RepID=UPI003D949211
MRLTRRQRRELAALAEQLAHEDPDLAAQLSRPAGPARRSPPGRTRVGVLIGQVLFVLGLLALTWGVLMSAPTATTVGTLGLLVCWVPWQWGSGNRRG